MSPAQREELLGVLESRFKKNMSRHQGLEWTEVKARLETHPEKLWSLYEMETTGGEPDVVGKDPQTGEILFFDCSPETPKGRTSICYDREGLESRKEHPPKNNAMDLAAAMGVELLTEEQYRELQELGEFDRKTSSWVKTPADIRNSVVPFLVTAASAACSFITTARSPTMVPGRSGGRSRSGDGIFEGKSYSQSITSSETP